MKNRKVKITTVVLVVVLSLLAVFIAVPVIRTAIYPFAPKATAEAARAAVTAPSPGAVERLSGGIRIPTVSEEISREENNPFDLFKKYLEESYPAVYAGLDTMTINEYGLVFRWKGKDGAKNPLLFCSHYDVVPVIGYEAETAPEKEIVFRPGDKPTAPINGFSTEWDYHPFSGSVADGRMYGRGTLDMKGMLFAIMEAVDELLAEGFVPERDIWLAFGFDEEIGGTEGALKIAEYFKREGITFDGVYDEGGIVSAPGLGGIDRALALVGTAEKGFCTIKISVHGTGGHSSMPPAKGSLVLAAEIIEKLNSEQMKARLIPPISSFLDNVGGTMGYASRLAIANKWLLGNTLLKNLSKSPATNALVRTTTAVTMARGSDAPNVLTSVSEIIVNFRILTGESVADVESHVRRICEGYDTEIEVLSAREPSNLSAEDARGFGVIGESVARIYPEAQVTSYLTIGGTDSYKYESVSGNVYRFMPVYLNEYEQRTIHNENEYISLEDYGKMIAHFKYIMSEF